MICEIANGTQKHGAPAIRHRHGQKKQRHVAEVILGAEDALPRRGMPTHLIQAILRKGKGKHDTGHDRHRAQNKKQLQYLIERVAGHDVVQEQNAGQKQGAGADRPGWPAARPERAEARG